MQQNVSRLTRQFREQLPVKREPVVVPTTQQQPMAKATAICTVHCGCGAKWSADGKHLMDAVVQGVRHAKNTGHTLDFDGKIKVVEG